MELTNPVVFVLTDGSGGSAASRLESTTSLLRAAGARPGSIFGKWTDREVYAALLSGNSQLFADVVRELARAFKAEAVECVVCDADEGYNPSHDLCRYLVTAAVLLHAREGGGHIETYVFTLVGRPDYCPDALREDSICVNLDRAAIGRKISSAAVYNELKGEVQSAVEKYGNRAVYDRVTWWRSAPRNGPTAFQNRTP